MRHLSFSATSQLLSGRITESAESAAAASRGVQPFLHVEIRAGPAAPNSFAEPSQFSFWYVCEVVVLFVDIHYLLLPLLRRMFFVLVYFCGII